MKIAILIVLALFVGGCEAQHSEKSEAPYVVLRATASNARWNGQEMEYHPAVYDIRHGNVLIHAECFTVDTDSSSIGCRSLPDQNIPVGVPLQQVTRYENQLSLPTADPLTRITLKITAEEMK